MSSWSIKLIPTFELDGGLSVSFVVVYVCADVYMCVCWCVCAMVVSRK